MYIRTNILFYIIVSHWRILFYFIKTLRHIINTIKNEIQLFKI